MYINISKTKSSSSTDLFEALSKMIFNDISKKAEKHVSKVQPFAVWADTDYPSKIDNIVREALENGLTVSGDGSNDTRRYNNPVGYLKQGEVLLFGTDDRFDVIRVPFNTAFKDYGKITGYSAAKDSYSIARAIREFGSEKQRLLKKYPANRDSRTLYEMNLLEQGSSKPCSCNKTNTSKTNKCTVKVMPDWIKVGTKIISKNISDTVVVEDINTKVIVPGYYSSRRANNSYNYCGYFEY